MALRMPGAPHATGQVQSLGRQEPGAPLAVANAEARASLTWGGVVNHIHKTANTILEDLADADKLQQVNLRFQRDANELATLQSFYKLNRLPAQGTPDYNALPEDIRTSVDAYYKANPTEDKTQGLETYKIQSQAWESATQRISAATYAALPSRWHGDYTNKMTPVIVNGTKSVTAESVTEYMDDLKAKQHELVSTAIAAGDEQQAEELIHEAHAAGIYTPAEFAEQITTLGPTMDAVSFQSMLYDANTPADVENAREFMESSRMLPEQKAKGYGQLESQIDQQYKDRGRWQDDNYAEANVLLNEGKLTTEWINDMGRRGGLSGGQISALRNAMKAGSITTNLVAVDEFEGAIASIRYVESADGSVSGNADALRESLRVARYGLTGPNGEVIEEPTLSGGDYADLMGQLDDAETNWAFSNPYYKQTVDQLKKITGYTDMISSITGEGSEAAFAAYRDGKASLDAYMDTLGNEADPRSWMIENASAFDRKNYANLSASSFLSNNAPEYLDYIAPGSDELDVPRIIDDAATRYETGDESMPRWKRDQIIRQISVLPMKGTTGSTQVGSAGN